MLEEFIKNTELKPFDPVDHSGYWRQVTVRSTLRNDLMVIVGMHPQDLSSEKLGELQLQLKTFFETGNGVQARVTSLYLQLMKLKYNNWQSVQ